MSLFNKLPGFLRSPTGLEQRIWRHLPALLLWGTLLPVLVVGANRALAPAGWLSDGDERALRLLDFVMLGIVLLNWTLVLTTALACFIVRVMKGPAYVADAYELKDHPDNPADLH